MTRVALFGLTVESEIPLPAPLAGEAAADVSIRYGSVPETLDGARIHGPGFASHEQAVLLRVDQVGRFLVRNAREVIVDPSPGAQPSWILHPLLAGVMGVVLQGRGVLTLHASAVRIGDAAVVFAGDRHAGKSTLAADLARRGHQVQSDSFVAVVDTATTPKVLPGATAQKLWPDAVECLGLAAIHPSLAPATTKQLVIGPDPVARQRVPIAQIYVLGSQITISRQRSYGSQRVTDLAGHLFMPGVAGLAGDQASQLLALVRNTAVGRLARAAGPLETSLASMSQEVLRCVT